MTSWKEVELRKLFSFKAGTGFPKKMQGSPTGDLPFAKVSDMNTAGNEITLSFAANYISQAQAKDLKAYIHKPGSIAFAKIGVALTYNRRRQIKVPLILDNNMMSAEPKAEKFSSKFAYYLLRMLDFNDIASGSALPYLTVSALNGISVKLPPLPEQREIAAILGALDDKIELNRKTAATLEGMARALYKSWFVDFDPVVAKSEGRQPAFMDAETAALFPNSFDDDGLPEGWAETPIGEILTLNYGKALRKDKRVPGQYPVYGSGGTDSTHTEALIVEPTVVVGRKGTVGSLHWEPRGCWPIDTTFFVISDLPMSFVFRTLQSLPLSEMNTDAAVPGLNRENAYRLEVPMASEAIIDAFDQQAGCMQGKMDHLSAENQTLAELRDTLLPKLMSGELRVGEAKEQVEDVA